MATALVTGASRGLGRGVALELARAGWSVAINYNSNREAAEATAAACAEVAREAGWGGAHAPSGARAAGTTSRGGVPGGGDARGVETSAPRFVPVQGNVGDASDRARMVDEAWAIAGRLDALVNNAGIAPRVRADITEAGEESFEELIHTNLQGPYFLTQAVVNRWMAEGGSVAEGVLPRSIVFVTSISATTASVNRGDYCISKAGLAMAAQLWAVRLAAEGINVYEVRPGVMETDMTSGVKERYDALIADGLVPQRRWGVPADIGRAVRSLVAGDFAFSTGAVIYSDGGFHLSRL